MNTPPPARKSDVSDLRPSHNITEIGSTRLPSVLIVQPTAIKMIKLIAAAMLTAAFPATGEALLQDLGAGAASNHPRNGDTP